MSVLASDSLQPSRYGKLVMPGWRQNLAVAGALILFAAAWAVHGIIVASPKALHFDILEAYAWGKEFQFGYFKHGPFWAWIAGAWFLLFPTTNTSFVLLEALNAAIGILGAWRLNGLFVKGWARHAATLLLMVTPFYTFMAYKYNASIIFISIWPWALFYFVRSLDCLKIRDAALFGALAAAAMLSKYYAVILLITCALSLTVHHNGRRYIFSPLPFIAGASFLAVFLPHLIWVVRNGAPTVTHAIAVTGLSWFFTLRSAGDFLFQTAAGFAVVALLIYIVSRTTKDAPNAEEDGRLPENRRLFLAVLALAPWLLTAAFGLGLRLELVPATGAGIFPLVPLLLMQFTGRLDGRRLFRAAGAAALVAALIAVVAAPIEQASSIKRGGSSLALPYQELAKEVTRLWHAETGSKLQFAGARFEYAYAMSFYSPDNPSSFTDMNFGEAPWITPEKIRRYGLAISCLHDDQACIGTAHTLVSGQWKQVPLTIAHKAGSRQMPDVQYEVFIIPPQGTGF